LLTVDQSAVVVPSGCLPDWISFGVLAASVPRDVVDDAVAAHGRGARRSDGKLPPHVVLYFAMAMALFAEGDYEEVMAQLSDSLARLGCWDGGWTAPTSGGITQARARLGWEVVAEVFGQVARPVADPLTRGAWLGGLRLVSVDGCEWDVPDSKTNAAEFGYPGTNGVGAFPKARMVGLVETGSRAFLAARIGAVRGAGSGEQSLARQLYPLLEQDMLLLADRNFYSFADWCQAADTGAQLLWRMEANLRLPCLQALPDGSYLSVVIDSAVKGAARARLLQAAADGEPLDPQRARIVRVVEYEVPDRGTAATRELICLATTLTDPTRAPAQDLAWAYHRRWEHELANGQLKSVLRGPGRILRSKSPDMVRQEIYGYLLTHYALSALICRAATEADIDPDRVKVTRTVRIVRRRIDDPAAFSP
jgi:hypothetical protein